MDRISRAGLIGLLGVLFWWGTVHPNGWAQPPKSEKAPQKVEPQKKSQQPQQKKVQPKRPQLLAPLQRPQLEVGEELRIGIPDFPRRIDRTLPPTRPERALSVGILKLHPSFVTSVEYDDNITLAERDEKEDVIFTQVPGVVGEVEFGDHRFEGGYGAEFVNFVKDGEENKVNHLGHGLLELHFGDLTFTAQDLFERTTNRLFNESSERDRVLINTVELLGRYDRPKWAAETGWRHNTIDHRLQTFDVNDYEEDVIANVIGFKVLPKTLLLVEVDAGFVNYHETGNANQNYWQILTGFQGDPTEDFSITAKIGFQDRQLGDVPGQGTQSDFDGLVANIDILYNQTENDSFRLGYVRTVRTSTFADNSWYRQDTISASYKKRFRTKWTLEPQFGWQFNDYPERATVGGLSRRRDDHYWQAVVKLRYEIQDWLSTGFTYRFVARNSNFETFDYESNRLIYDITFAY